MTLADLQATRALRELVASHGLSAVSRLLADIETETDASRTVRAYVRVHGLSAAVTALSRAVAIAAVPGSRLSR